MWCLLSSGNYEKAEKICTPFLEKVNQGIGSCDLRTVKQAKELAQIFDHLRPEFAEKILHSTLANLPPKQDQQRASLWAELAGVHLRFTGKEHPDRLERTQKAHQCYTNELDILSTLPSTTQDELTRKRRSLKWIQLDIDEIKRDSSSEAQGNPSKVDKAGV